MRDRIYIATFSEDAESVAKQYGFSIELNDFCISENLDPERIKGSLEAARRELQAAGAEHAIMHGPFTEIIPASIDHRAVELGMERLQQAYQAARDLGINRMVVHSGYMPLLYFKDWHHAKSVEFWRMYMADKPDEFSIYIENVFEDEPCMMHRLIEDIGDSRVGICLDIGHANAVTSEDYDIMDWIQILGPQIRHFHLHNNDGNHDQHASLDQGIMNMDVVMDTIRHCCRQDVTMTIESRSCRESAQWIEDWIRRGCLEG